MTDFMADFGPMLIENGYNIIPVVQGTKRPALANWSKIKATPELIESWDADASIGITTGEVVAIDVDIYDKHVTNAIVKYCDQHIGKGLRRIGKAPKGFFYSVQTRLCLSQSRQSTWMKTATLIALKYWAKGSSLLPTVFILIHNKNTTGLKTVLLLCLSLIFQRSTQSRSLSYSGSSMRSAPSKWKRSSPGSLQYQPLQPQLNLNLNPQQIRTTS